jgi:multidrug efflux pump subunit AcrA (membrane-fusion protein)
MPIEISHNGNMVTESNGQWKTDNLLRSTEATELISNHPSFIVRWGVSILFLIAVCLLTVTWFIRYPDIVSAGGILNSINAPKEIIAKTPGKLQRLMVKEGQLVHKNDVLGYIESTADHSGVLELSRMLDTISMATANDQSNRAVDYLSRRFDNLGELQGPYQVFAQSLQEFANYLHNGFYLKKKKMLLADLDYLRRLYLEQLQQRNLMVQDLSLTDSTFRSQEELKNDKVISVMDYRNEKSKMLSKQMTLTEINAALIGNESQQHEKQKEIAELENQIKQQKNIFIQSLNTVRSLVEEWKKKYLLTAPIDGQASFASFLQENQELKNGQLICYINPGNTDYYAEALIPQYNFGKIKTGQEVLLKFPAYPYSEFGALKGKIEFISTIPTDSGYFAKVSLPAGLITTYNKRIQYRAGLRMEGEIITADLRLIERFLNTLRKNTSR